MPDHVRHRADESFVPEVFEILAKDIRLLLRIAQFLAVLIGLSAIYLIIFYQFWQNTEREKLQRITAKFSNLARSVRSVSSGREAGRRLPEVPDSSCDSPQGS